MSNRKRTLVYPFSREFLPWFSYFQTYQPEYEITALVTPQGFSMNGKDAGVIDNRNRIGILAEEDVDAALETADALLVQDSAVCQKIREKVLEKMRKAKEKGMDILCSLPLSEEERSELEGEGFHYFAEPTAAGVEYANTFKLEELSVPVVFVGELLEDTNAIDTLFSLAGRFRRDGYQVCTIGARKDSRMAGVHSLPAFFYEPMLGEEKALRLNRFLYELTEEEQPDVVLIQLPGGMFKFNNRHTNGMGIGAYLVSQAAECDCFVLSASCGFASVDMFRDLDQKFRLCFGFGIDAAAVSNRVYDSMTQIEVYGKMEYYCLSPERVKEMIQAYCVGSATPYFQQFCEEEEQKLYQTVVSALADQTVSY